MGSQGLTRLVAPPARPVDADGDWTAAETALGVRVPEDYRPASREDV